jgi:predicted phage tail protein
MSETYISGAKGGGKGGGGGAARVAVEAPDSLKSRQYAKILDLLGEGEIGGLISGLKSVLLNDTPIQNADGTTNFSGVTLEFRNGTQEQAPISGFKGTEVESSVGLEITKALPITKTVTDPDVDRLRLTLGVPRLTQQNTTNGDITGSSVTFNIAVQSNGGGFQDVPITLTSQASAVSVSGSPISTNGTFITLNTGSSAVGISGSIVWSRPVTGSSLVRVINTETPAWNVWNPYTYQTVNLYGGTPPTITLEYNNNIGSGWVLLSTNTFTNPTSTTLGTSEIAVDFSNLPAANYSFRVTKVSGSGSVSMTSPAKYLYVGSATISGKTNTKYQRNITIPLTGSAPWDIKITRITADSTSSALVNNLYWDSYTSIIDERLSYPNSAYAFISVDSEQFDRVPSRSYHVRLLKVKIPTNYDPNTKIYTGLWDGTFKVAWTNNPAWCFYDLVTNTRYGLGSYIQESQIDKWDLYNIGKYCDELVPDGFGGQESRFTLNIYMQTREDAIKVIQSLVSVFRGMTYWAAGSLSTIQDSPADPVAIFSKANVVGGQFTYSGTSIKARHSIALVTWNDPGNLYKPKVEYVEDKDSVLRYGIREAEVMAVGCTSRGQANRLGKWLLYSEKLETETVVFTAGLDGTVIRPGEIIQIADVSRAGIRYSGRLLKGSQANKLILDSPVTFSPDKNYTVSVVMPYNAKKLLPNGEYSESNLGAIETYDFIKYGTSSEIILNTPLSMIPEANAMWMLSEQEVEAQQFRVLGISEESPNIYQITAIEHNPTKFDFIDKDEQLQTDSISIILDSPLAPTNLEASEILYISGSGTVLNRIDLSWDFISSSTSYYIEYKLDSGNWVPYGNNTTVANVTIYNTQVGVYSFQVYSIDSLGRRSSTPALLENFIALGKTAPPANVTGFTALSSSTGVKLSWNPVADLDLKGYTIKYGIAWESAIVLAELINSTTFEHTTAIEGENFYLIRAEDTSGNLSTLITSTALTLEAPASVRRFIATQTANNIQLDWAPLEGAALYEVREGTSWSTSVFVTRTNTTYFNLAAGFAQGDRTFLLKAISSNGLYSYLASSTTTAIAEIPYRNIVVTVDKELDSYAGRHINTQNVAGTVQLVTAADQQGEFIFDIDLGYFTEAQSTGFYTSSVAEIDTLSWDISTFAWNSSTAGLRAWLPLQDVDISTVYTTLEIATDPGTLKAGLVDAIRLDGTSSTYLGTALAESINATTFITAGRTGDGLNRLPSTVASWGITIPEVFSILVWVNPEEVFTNGFEYFMFTLYNTTTSAFLKVTYKDGELLMADELGNLQILTYALAPDKLFALVVSQSTIERKLMVSNIYDSDNATVNIQTISPSGAFNSLRLY